MKCPFCYQELDTSESNVKQKYRKGVYVARCKNPECGVDVIISRDDIVKESKP